MLIGNEECKKYHRWRLLLPARLSAIPDQTFRNFTALKSGEKMTLCYSESPIDGF